MLSKAFLSTHPKRNEAFTVFSVESYLVQDTGRAQFLVCQKFLRLALCRVFHLWFEALW